MIRISYPLSLSPLQYSTAKYSRSASWKGRSSEVSGPFTVISVTSISFRPRAKPILTLGELRSSRSNIGGGPTRYFKNNGAKFTPHFNKPKWAPGREKKNQRGAK